MPFKSGRKSVPSGTRKHGTTFSHLLPLNMSSQFKKPINNRKEFEQKKQIEESDPNKSKIIEIYEKSYNCFKNC